VKLVSSPIVRRSWKLASGGVQRVNGRELERGKEWHRKQGRNLHFSGRLRALAIVLLVLGMLLIVVAGAVANYGVGWGV